MLTVSDCGPEFRLIRVLKFCFCSTLSGAAVIKSKDRGWLTRLLIEISWKIYIHVGFCIQCICVSCDRITPGCPQLGNLLIRATTHDPFLWLGILKTWILGSQMEHLEREHAEISIPRDLGRSCMAYDMVKWHQFCQIYQSKQSQAHSDSREKGIDPDLDGRTIKEFWSTI